MKRAEFSSASRTELIRYFCLSATRNRKYRDSEACIILLDRVYETKGMAAFLRADVLEHQRKFPEAIREYRLAIELNKDKISRLERTYRPTIRCILNSPQPDYGLAESYAIKWGAIRKTVFSMMALARVYLHWKYLGAKHNRDLPSNIDKLYSDALSQLEIDPGVGSAHFELKAEEAQFSGDFDGALGYMDAAIQADPRFELRSTRWRMMAKSRVPVLTDRVLTELNAARNNPEYRSNWVPFLPGLAESYAIALKAAGRPLGQGCSTLSTESHCEDGL